MVGAFLSGDVEASVSVYAMEAIYDDMGNGPIDMQFVLVQKNYT